jgi:diguanylate cyclase (GGDEF)-like protein
VDASDYHISRLTAEFTHPQVESDFREATYPARVRETRIAIAIAVVFYLAFAITDYLAVGMGEEYRLIFLTRLSLCAVGIAVAWSAGRLWRALTEGITPSLVESLALVGFLSITLLRPYGAGWHGMSLMVMLLGVYVFIPNRFLPATVVAVLATLAFIWLLTQHFQPPDNYVLTLSLLLIALNLLGILAAHRVSRLLREAYRDTSLLLRAKDELAREIEARRGLETELGENPHRDALAGISNRCHFFDQADRAFDKARANGTPLSLVIADIDYFRQISDTYGQSQADEALRVLAKVCRSTLGDVELLARLGGEEFVLLLPGVDLAAASARAERLRVEVQRAPLRLRDGSLHFTISLGVAQWRPGESLPLLMRRADEALYAARHKGSNRTESADGEATRRALEPAGGRDENTPQDSTGSPP